MTRRVSSGGLLSSAGEHPRGFRRILVLLTTLVTAPTAVLLAVGVLMLVFYRERLNLVFGALVVGLVICVVTGTVLVQVFLHREAKLSQLQSDFVSKVSHELRTPLTSIRLFVETLQMGKVGDDEREVCVTALARETARLTERIERLLDWGRMEAGKRVYELQADTLPAIVNAALGAFQTATVGHDVEVKVELADDLPTIQADRAALVDALVNLLSNAHKYSEDTPDITLSVRADRRWVYISVADQGIGIPATEQRRIFQKFYRVDERLSQAMAGTGLGLAIVRHVARAHGGQVSVESAPGEGSTFTLALPRPTVESAAAPRSDARASA